MIWSTYATAEEIEERARNTLNGRTLGKEFDQKNEYPRDLTISQRSITRLMQDIQ